RILRPATHEGRQRSKPRVFAGGWCPRRPFLLAANRRHTTPCLPLFADSDAVADRLPLRQHVIEKFVAGIDEDRAGGFPARVLDDVTPVLHRNRRLRVGQIGHQMPVAGAPAGLSRRRQCSLHAAAEDQGGNYKGNCTRGHKLVPHPLLAKTRAKPILLIWIMSSEARRCPPGRRLEPSKIMNSIYG